MGEATEGCIWPAKYMSLDEDTDSLYRKLAERRGWIKKTSQQGPAVQDLASDSVFYLAAKIGSADGKCGGS